MGNDRDARLALYGKAIRIQTCDDLPGVADIVADLRSVIR